MKTRYLLMVIFSLINVGCSHTPYIDKSEFGQLKHPQDVEKYLQKHVGKETLKKWDSMQIDGNSVIKVVIEN